MNRTLVILTILLAGCGRDQQLDTAYGKRRGIPGGESVHGTAALATMVSRAGHRVTTWSRLSPRLEESQVIFWAPDDIHPPTQEVRGYLEKWLQSEPGRVLVYIGRDYDAAAEYWEAVLPGAPPTPALEIRRRLAKAQAEHDQRLARIGPSETDWFRLQPRSSAAVSRELSGPWSEGIDASLARIRTQTRLTPPAATSAESPQPTLPATPLEAPKTELAPETESAPEAGSDPGSNPEVEMIAPTEPPRNSYDASEVTESRVLLADEQGPLAFEITSSRWFDGRILVINNGAFLLNFPLVNHTHRQIAARMIEGLPAKSRVVFLESSEGGPHILDHDPDTKYPTGMEALTVWPLGAILMHLTALGILVCFVYFPIFGRPREQTDLDDPATGTTSTVATLIGNLSRADFGRHVSALAELLERTGDRAYALGRWYAWHQQNAHIGRTASVPASSTDPSSRHGTPFGPGPATSQVTSSAETVATVPAEQTATQPADFDQGRAQQ